MPEDLKRISLMFPAKCSLCWKRLGRAELAWHEKGLGTFCEACKPSVEKRGFLRSRKKGNRNASRPDFRDL